MSQEKREELRWKLDGLDAEESARLEGHNIATLHAPGTASADGETGCA